MTIILIHSYSVDLAKLMSIMNNESNGEGKRDGDDQLPDHLAPKQRELFMRIQGQQKDNKPGHEGGDKDYGGKCLKSLFSCACSTQTGIFL